MQYDPEIKGLSSLNEGIIISLQEVIKRSLNLSQVLESALLTESILMASTCIQSLCQSTRFPSAHPLISEKLITMDIGIRIQPFKAYTQKVKTAT